MSTAVEPILEENEDRFVIFPIKHDDLWDWYKKCEACFWTAEEMPLFDSYLEKHAFNFISSTQSASLEDYNKVAASDIVERFLRANAYNFLKNNL